MNDAVDALTQRVDRLERENRWLKRMGTFLVSALGAVAVMGATATTPPNEVRAKRFVVVGDDGKQRGVLGQRPLSTRHGPVDGETGLYLLDAKADIDNPRALMTVSDTGWQKLGFFDPGPEGKVRVWLVASEDGDSVLSLHPRRGVARVGARVGSDGSSSLLLPDKGDNVRASLLLFADGSPVLSLSDSTKKPRAVLGHADLGVSRTEVVERRPASSLVPFDKDGNVIWKAS